MAAQRTGGFGICQLVHQKGDSLGAAVVPDGRAGSFGAAGLNGLILGCHPAVQHADAPLQSLYGLALGGALPTLEMAVDRLRQVVYFVGAGIKSGVEDEILKAIAAVLVKVQIADGRAAVEGIPDELRAAVLQELAVVAVGGQVTGRARRVGLRGLGAVGTDVDQLVIGTDDVSAGVLRLLQQQGQRTGQQQIVVVAEGHIHALSDGKPPVAGGTDTGVFLGDDLDAVVPQGQIVAKAGGGIGGAVIIDGKLFNGYANRGTELGHVPLIANGERCACGAIGCLEHYASTSALVRHFSTLAKERNLSFDMEINGELIVRLYHENFPMAVECMSEHFYYLGRGIAGFVNIFSPQRIVLGGGVTESGIFYLEKIREVVREHVIADCALNTEIVAASLGNKAGFIGAASLILK